MTEDARTYNLQFSREDDDIMPIPGMGEQSVLRISIGGMDEIGYYCKFRGSPESVVRVLEMMTEAAKHQLPRGGYNDLRT